MQKRKMISILVAGLGILCLPAFSQTTGHSASGTTSSNSSTNRSGTGTAGSFGTHTNSVSSGNTNTNNTGSGSTASNTDTNILLLPNFPGTNFLVLAAAGSLLEVQLGLIAETNSSNAAVQQYGQTLAVDHSKSYQDAANLAKSLGVTLRTLDEEEQGIVKRFEGLTGDAFDRLFIRYTIQDHVQDIGRYEVSAERAWNWDIRSYAANNLPVLLKHLTMALNIREALLGNQPLTP